MENEDISVSLSKVKKCREKIANLIKQHTNSETGEVHLLGQAQMLALDIVDDLIKECERKRRKE